jgi:hypothetical protein
VCDLLCGGHITMEAWKKALLVTNSFIKWNANECENDFVQALFVTYVGEKPMRHQKRFKVSMNIQNLLEKSPFMFNCELSKLVLI